MKHVRQHLVTQGILQRKAAVCQHKGALDKQISVSDEPPCPPSARGHMPTTNITLEDPARCDRAYRGQEEQGSPCLGYFLPGRGLPRKVRDGKRKMRTDVLVYQSSEGHGAPGRQAGRVCKYTQYMLPTWRRSRCYLASHRRSHAARIILAVP